MTSIACLQCFAILNKNSCCNHWRYETIQHEYENSFLCIPLGKKIGQTLCITCACGEELKYDTINKTCVRTRLVQITGSNYTVLLCDKCKNRIIYKTCNRNKCIYRFCPHGDINKNIIANYCYQKQDIDNCTKCYGTGAYVYTHEKICSTCGGTGMKKSEQVNNYDFMYDDNDKICQRCAGGKVVAGESESKECPHCVTIIVHNGFSI